jgi:Flp pilus assembly protein TadG
MSAFSLIRRLLGDRRAAAAIEFAFVAPLLIGFTGAIFEVIFIAYDFNLASEATRRGLRTALVQDPLGSIIGINTTPVECSKSGSAVNCNGGAPSSSSGSNFNTILTTMQAIKTDLAASNIQISYATSGLDDPVTAPGVVTPLVTVKLIGLTYNFRLLTLIPGAPTSFQFPAFTSSAVGASSVP